MGIILNISFNNIYLELLIEYYNHHILFNNFMGILIFVNKSLLLLFYILLYEIDYNFLFISTKHFNELIIVV